MICSSLYYLVASIVIDSFVNGGNGPMTMLLIDGINYGFGYQKELKVAVYCVQ